MKMKTSDYNDLKDAINNVLKEKIYSVEGWQEKIVEWKNQYTANCPELNPDLALAWQLFHGITGYRIIQNRLYAYLNDNHIETALKRIVPSVAAIIERGEA